MLALALAAAITSADLQQWINDQPEVQAYELRTRSIGLRLPPEDAFRQSPRLPRSAACEARTRAMAAAVALFKTSDGSKLTLIEPELLAKNDGQPILMLNDDGKKVLTDRAKDYEQAAGRYEPACLG